MSTMPPQSPHRGTITGKLIAIAFFGGMCIVASFLVLGAVAERQERYMDATREISESWGKRQTVVGPMLVVARGAGNEEVHTYVLPRTLTYEVVLVPEIRARGIFRTVVYQSQLRVSGEFSGETLRKTLGSMDSALFTVMLTDTRGIEKEVTLSWNESSYAFLPGAGIVTPDMSAGGGSGIHTRVPLSGKNGPIPFSFAVNLHGSEGLSVAPLGNETSITMSSAWGSPKFIGAFLPAEREITPEGFTAAWRVSSFGRSYPDTWAGDSVPMGNLATEVAGVELVNGVDTYDLTFRSVKYAALFIVITFGAYFLFDVRRRVRIHPVQYFLIGCALALFYLLLLSLSEHIGFAAAYILGATMTIILVGGYSAYALRGARRALPIIVLLGLLYGYLFFVLRLEDYALLFGSLLLFVFLAVTMFLTRKIDWYAEDTVTDPDREVR